MDNNDKNLSKADSKPRLNPRRIIVSFAFTLYCLLKGYDAYINSRTFNAATFFVLALLWTLFAFLPSNPFSSSPSAPQDPENPAS